MCPDKILVGSIFRLLFKTAYRVEENWATVLTTITFDTPLHVAIGRLSHSLLETS